MTLATRRVSVGHAKRSHGDSHRGSLPLAWARSTKRTWVPSTREARPRERARGRPPRVEAARAGRRDAAHGGRHAEEQERERLDDAVVGDHAVAVAHAREAGCARL